jgi:phage N-6-adenine-methyltransferase
MQVAERFGGDEIYQIDKFAPSALYLLAAPSTPEPAREEAIARAEAGETITHTVSKVIVNEHKTPSAEAPAPQQTVPAQREAIQDTDSTSIAQSDANEPLTTHEGEVMQGRSTRAEHSRIVMTQSDSNEWYTPAHIIDLARETLGGIDLDPASCELANQTVQAEHYYTEDDNGLSLPWNGRVWMNPPYGELAGKFVHRFVSEYQAGNIDAGIILVKAATDTAWFRPLFEYPICFIHGRVKFYTSETEGIATFPSVCIYLGEDDARFCGVFSAIGRVMKGVVL